MAPTVRRLGRDDLVDFRGIRLSALRISPDAFGSTLEVEAAQSDEQYAARLENSVVLGAYAAGEIVGLLGGKRYDSPREAHKAFLWGFYVAPVARRSGVGRLLLDSMVDAMRGVVDQLLLTVVADNDAAIALYEHRGFERYGREPRALATSTGFADELLMVLFLPPNT